MATTTELEFGKLKLTLPGSLAAGAGATAVASGPFIYSAATCPLCPEQDPLGVGTQIVHFGLAKLVQECQVTVDGGNLCEPWNFLPAALRAFDDDAAAALDPPWHERHVGMRGFAVSSQLNPHILPGRPMAADRAIFIIVESLQVCGTPFVAGEPSPLGSQAHLRVHVSLNHIRAYGAPTTDLSATRAVLRTLAGLSDEAATAQASGN